VISKSFKLCPEAERLYLVWSAALEAKAADKGEKKKAYLQHRKTCTECSPMVRMVEEEE